MNKFGFLMFLLIALLMQSCLPTQQTTTTTYTPEPPKPKVVNLALIKDAPSNVFLDLDYGVRISVNDERATENILKKYDASTTSKPNLNVEPDVNSFVSESMRQYMRTMGFKLDANVSTDYMMQVTITEFNVSYLSGLGWSGMVKMNVEVYDHNRKLVYPNVPISGRANKSGSSTDWSLASVAINTAYVKALEDIDWDRIAYFLHGSNPDKKVTGDGTTALEKSVIRWYITSKPQGADVYWRVVSSTSDVKNTNQNFLGSTPYESTETLDIKGLKMNNAGNVQIEVSIEKDGYVTQKKRFNVEQVIDQKEISTKFNLVKEDE